MNFRSTTLFIKRNRAHKSGSIKRAFILSIAVLLGAIGSISYFQSLPVSADQYDDKIRTLQANMEQYQAEADRLNAQATTLANTLAQLSNDKKALEAQVAITQAQYDKLVVQIADTEKQISDNKDALGTTLADLYVDDDISPLEMLASSKNLGDFLNKQEYRNSIKDQLSATIKKVKALKDQLTQQKADVADVLAKQKQARDEVAAKEAEQANLLAKTKNDEATYQRLISDSSVQIAAAKAAQAAIRNKSNSTGGYTLVDSGLLNAYPWNSSNCPMLGYLSTGGVGYSYAGRPPYDGQDGWGYGCRQCVSYVAWRIAKETHSASIPSGLGNGGSAAYNAATKYHYQNLGSTPQPGSVASLWGTSYPPYSNESNPGHTAWVEDVSADGSKVLVSQYNYNYGAGWGMYSMMWLSSSFFDQYTKVN